MFPEVSKASTPATSRITQITRRTTPVPAAMSAHFLASLAASRACAYAPEAHSELTFLALTMDTMPNGRQQKTVVRMPHTTLFPGAASCPYPDPPAGSPGDWEGRMRRSCKSCS
jgi:hypothetical protein